MSRIDTIHSDLGQPLRTLMLYQRIIAAVAIAYGWSGRVAPGGWLLLAWGVAMFIAFTGTWYAREWARWACGMLSTLMAVYCLSGVQLEATRSGVFGVVEFTIVAVTCGWLAWYSLRHSMREDFRAVRDAIARARAVPG